MSRDQEHDEEAIEFKQVSDYTQEEIRDAFVKAVNFFKEIDGIDINRMRSQFAYVKMTIDAFAEGRESVIIEAPTGFGKSFYAYALTKVFEYLDKENSSYLLTSNKFLQQQYQNDIKNFDLRSYKMLKGQGNYQCTVNQKSFLERECGDDSVASVMQSSDWKGCVGTCPYIQARIAAMRAKCTVFNYNYWLTTMNHVYPMLGPNSPFVPRTLTVFDETHVLGNIVQDMFAVEINLNTVLRRLTGYYGILREAIFDGEKPELDADNLGKIVDSYEAIQNNIEDTNIIYSKVIQLGSALGDLHKRYLDALDKLIKKLPVGPDEKPMLQDVHKDLLKFNATLAGWTQSISQNIDLYNELGKETIVATVSDNYNEKEKILPQYGKISKTTLKLQCTNESSLCKNAVMQRAEYKVFMSATLGDIDAYAEQTGIENYAKIVVPQVFDFEPSPIYSVTPMLSMNFKNKTVNKPAMVQRVIKIIENNPGQRGLVHTGNYELMRALKDANHPRIITYGHAGEKDSVIKQLRDRPDAVICGPSLVEGVDFKDELCRFMIFMKVPFLSMGDRLTKKKMAIYPKWYGWVTMSNILQALGRGVRNENDWCKTYLLDSSFSSFFARNSPPEFITKRMKQMQSHNIGVEYNPDAEFDAIEW